MPQALESPRAWACPSPSCKGPRTLNRTRDRSRGVSPSLSSVLDGMRRGSASRKLTVDYEGREQNDPIRNSKVAGLHVRFGSRHDIRSDLVRHRSSIRPRGREAREACGTCEEPIEARRRRLRFAFSPRRRARRASPCWGASSCDRCCEGGGTPSDDDPPRAHRPRARHPHPWIPERCKCECVDSRPPKRR